MSSTATPESTGGTDAATDDEVLGAVAKVALKSGRVEDAMTTLLRAHERDPSDHEWMVAMVAHWSLTE